MATIRSDIQSMMSSMSPLRKVPREPDARVIAHRWEFHKPFALMAARQSLDPAAAFAAYKERHAERLTMLRRANIQPEVIYRNRYDDPIPTPERFADVLAEAIERRRARMGRVKGRVKPPHRVGYPQKAPKRKSKGRTE